jgi:hypothetical protein
MILQQCRFIGSERFSNVLSLFSREHNAAEAVVEDVVLVHPLVSIMEGKRRGSGKYIVESA